MTAAVATQHLPFLVHGEYHLSPRKARIAAVDLLTRLNQKRPSGGWEKTRVTVTKSDGAVMSATFIEIVAEIRRFGIHRQFQRLLDKQDAVFGGTLAEEMGTPNYQLRMKTQFGGFKAEAQGPCRSAAVEYELTEDILHSRVAACRHSDEHDFRLTSRHFRNYLSACVSIVDAFVNRHIHAAKADGFTSPEFEDLQLRRKAEDRVNLLWKVICSDDPKTLLDSPYWCHFQEIRQKRNEIVHCVNPIAFYSIPEIQRYLNKAASIGEVLLILRNAHRKSTVGFIERLRTAPKVKYQQIRFRQEGEVVERVDEG